MWENAFIPQTHRFKGGEHPGFLFVAPFMQENSFAVGLSDYLPDYLPDYAKDNYNALSCFSTFGCFSASDIAQLNSNTSLAELDNTKSVCFLD